MDFEYLAEIAHTRALFYGLLNAHFLAIPDTDCLQQNRSEVFLDLLSDLAVNRTLSPDLSHGAALMLDYLQETAEWDENDLLNRLNVDRTRLYRGIAPGYGPPPPCEAVWVKANSDPARILQELVEVYRQSGLFLAAENCERPDYIGVELLYLQHLAEQEAEAWQSGREGAACGLLVDQSLFLSQHAGCWLPEFVEKAMPMAETDYFKGHLGMIAGFLSAEEERIREILGEFGL